MAGGWIHPDADPREEGRVRFLEAVERVAPEVLEDLQENVLPAYGDMFGPGRLFASLHPQDVKLVVDRTPDGKTFTRLGDPWLEAERIASDPGRFLDAIAEAGRDGSAFLESLAAWGRRWSLTDAWILEAAARTLYGRAWRGWSGGWRLAHPERWTALAYYTPEESFAMPTPPAPRSWNPLLQTKNEYHQTMMSGGIVEYERRVQEWIRRVGLRETGDTRDGTRVWNHFEWLARWQVLGQTYGQIAANPAGGSGPRLTVSENSVGAAVRSRAREISLTRRSRRGTT